MTDVRGNEPGLKRLWATLETINETVARPLSAAEEQDLAGLRQQLEALQNTYAALEMRINTYVQVRYPQTGRRFRVRQNHVRQHPEIVKTAYCRGCGQQFVYEVYATGWTRQRCPDCRLARRRQYMRDYQHDRRHPDEPPRLNSARVEG